MERKIKAVAFGAGKTACDAILHFIDKGIELVGVVDINKKIIGKDIAEVLNLDKPLGVVIEEDAAALLERTNPDIAFVCTGTAIASIFDTLKLCVEHKVNVVSTSEEAFWYRRTNPELGAELDRLAKENGVTILGTGIQDAFYTTVSVGLAAACHKVKKLKGTNYALVDRFGVISNKKNAVGMTVEEFEKSVKSDEKRPPNAFTIGLYTLAARLGLTVKDEIETRAPFISKDGKDIYCPAYDEYIPAGHVIGTNYHTELKTEEGIDLISDFNAKLAEEGDTGICHWSIEGEPNLEMDIPDMRGELTTAAGLIARVPDVINAKPGFISVADLDFPKYYVRDLNEYVNE